MEPLEPLPVRLLAKPGIVFGLALASLAAGFLAALSFGSISESLRGHRPIVLGWRTAQFFFNYQDLGFVKRGLIGSLLHPFPALQTRAGLLGISALFLVVLAAAFCRVFAACTRGAPVRTAALLAALALLMPSFFLRFGFDYGRYDSVNLALALGALGLIRRGRLGWAAVLCALSVLVHEAFIVLQFPLLLAYALSRSGPRPDFRRVGWRLAALPLATTALVFAFGSYRPGAETLTAYFAHTPAYLALDGQVNLDAIAIPTRHFFENFHYNAEMFRQKRALLHLPIVAAWFALVLACYDRFHRRNGGEIWRDVQVRQVSVFLLDRREELIAEAQTQGQIAEEAPVILAVETHRLGAEILAGCAIADRR